MLNIDLSIYGGMEDQSEKNSTNLILGGGITGLAAGCFSRASGV